MMREYVEIGILSYDNVIQIPTLYVSRVAVASQISWGPFDRFEPGAPPLDPNQLK